LDVAINTPDIALIVGPPGTGKTQVIAALQRRLAETLGENSLQHQVLISSYQHDAVDNALNRAEVFGLPAVRIGGRGRRDEGGVDPVSVWCERKRKEISVRLDAIRLNEPLTQPLEELDRRITALRLASMSAQERQTQFEQIDVLLRQLFDLDIRLIDIPKYAVNSPPSYRLLRPQLHGVLNNLGRHKQNTEWHQPRYS
jgi:DNA polymerase III delta prime subunit